VVERTLERLKREVKPEHFQIYYLYGVKGLSAAKVMEQLGASRANIYQVYRRLNRLFRKTEHDLRVNMDEGAIVTNT